MENEKDIVVEETTEIVDESTEVQAEQIEQPAEMKYTEEEFRQRLDEVLGKKIPRIEAKIRKEYDQKYGELENVLRAGTGRENVEDMTSEFRRFYEERGVEIPTTPAYTGRDAEILARAEANDIINAGFEEVVEEVDRLAGIGLANMSPMEKEVFRTLAEYRKATEQKKELAKIGVTEDVYDSKEFQEFASKFSSNTPVTDIYDIYNKMQPKKNIRTIGSMKSNAPADSGVKDFYSYEEAVKFTKQDFDNNPELYKAVQKSMQKW